MNCTCWTYWRPGMAVSSDLNLSPILRRAALLDLCRMDENSYTLSQWRDTVRYLTGDERDFASVKEIQAFIKQDMEAEG